MPTFISYALVSILPGLAFFAGWRLRDRWAKAERATLNYATCGSMIGLRLCLDRNDESLRDCLTHLARIQYRLWHEGRRADPPPFSPSTDELFRIAGAEFAAELAPPRA